jgi:hypothetical protein
MKDIYTLKSEAAQAALWRGHVLGPWTHHRDHQDAGADCRNCKAWVMVSVKPASNSIDIGGPAVAINCK